MATATRPPRQGPPLGWPFLLLFNLIIAPASAGEAGGARLCELDRTDETSRVEVIVDGDTLRLRDGRTVRIIGLNAPEVANRDKPAQPFGNAARDALRKLVSPNAMVRLRRDHESLDKYGRILAHVATQQGINLTAQMIIQGAAQHWVVPPNDWNASCYAQLEQQARRLARGLWSSDRYRATPVGDLSAETNGYHMITGRIQRVREYPDAVMLYFDGKLRLRVRAEDASYFAATDWKSMAGRNVIVRGWVHRKGASLEMQIRHPTAIELIGGASVR